MNRANPNGGARLDWQRHGLKPSSRRIVGAALAAMLCDEDADGRLVPPAEPVRSHVAEELSLFIGAGSLDVRRGFGLLLWVIELAPLFFVGRFSRMSSLELEARVEYLEALETSRFGVVAMVLVALKIPACMIAFEDPELLAETGFDRESTFARRRLPVAPPGASGAAPAAAGGGGRTSPRQDAADAASPSSAAASPAGPPSAEGTAPRSSSPAVNERGLPALREARS